MVKKIKVSKEVAKAIEYVKREGYDFNTILRVHINRGWHTTFSTPLLHELSSEQLATALIVGYEVEMTPHEQIATIYNHHYSKFHHVEHKAEKYFSKGYVKGIRFTLEKLGITIEGVNDK